MTARQPGGDGLFRAAVNALSDRLVEVTGEVLGDDLDDRLARITQFPNESGFDAFGADPLTMRTTLATIAYLYRWYFRAEVHGIENVPQGRVLLVSNHAGQVALDGVMIVSAMVLDADPPRFTRSMVEKWSATLPFVSVWFSRVGQIVGSPENARRLLEQEEPLLVFPEGMRGVTKTFDKRYQLMDFGLGFMRLALETDTPIVPVAVVGAEEQYISVGNMKRLAKLLHLPSLPLMPQLMLGFPLPLPTKYHLHFGEPLRFRGDPDDDDSVIEEKVWVVKQTIQSMLNRGLKQRQGIFW